MVRRNYILILISITFLVSGCKEVIDFYLGVPLQPRFDEYDFQPGLNIFGLVRTDSTSSYNNSFVEAQKAVRAIGSEDSLGVDTVRVFVSKIDSSGNDEYYQFNLTNFENLFKSTKYRPDKNFKPQAGDIFKIECAYLDLPQLTAYTIVPNPPTVLTESIVNNTEGCYFEIENDTSIFMFDIYAFSKGNLLGYLRLEASAKMNTEVQLVGLEKPDSVSVYGYDYNLANYYLTSNTSLNFNKYRQTFSEVKNGYGVFGSLNKTVYRFGE